MRALLRLLPASTCILLLGACAGTPPAAPAARAPVDTPAPSGTPLSQLEAIFWACDYVATTKGMDATPVAQCAAATRELRRVKFANSFQAMLAWWRENKETEHGRLSRERGGQPL